MLDNFSELQAKVEMSTKQLERATELIGGLGGEGERWSQAAIKLDEIGETLTGEILLSTKHFQFATILSLFR